MAVEDHRPRGDRQAGPIQRLQRVVLTAGPIPRIADGELDRQVGRGTGGMIKQIVSPTGDGHDVPPPPVLGSLMVATRQEVEQQPEPLAPRQMGPLARSESAHFRLASARTGLIGPKRVCRKPPGRSVVSITTAWNAPAMAGPGLAQTVRPMVSVHCPASSGAS